MITTDAVAIAIQHAAENTNPADWSQLLHDVNVARQTAVIHASITGPGMVRMREGHYLMQPIDVLLEQAMGIPAAGVDLSLAVRHALAGNHDLVSKHLMMAINAAVDSVAELNATALDNNELRLPMEFGVTGAKS